MLSVPPGQSECSLAPVPGLHAPLQGHGAAVAAQVGVQELCARIQPDPVLLHMAT